MKRLITWMVAMTTFGAAAATITLDTGSLPSTQGWEYKASGWHAGSVETDVFSTDGFTLIMNSIDMLSSTSISRYKDVVDNSELTVLEWTSRTLEKQGDPNRMYGFCVGFNTGTLQYGVGIMPDRVGYIDGYGKKFIFMDATEFHTYRIETVVGAPTYKFYIDGVLRATSAPRSWAALNGVFFGDGTIGSNTRAEITALNFSQLSVKIGLTDPLNKEDCVEATGPEGATVHLFADESDPSPSKIYSWSTSLGDSGSGETFECVVGVDQQVEVSLTTEDTATGESGTLAKTVCVSDTIAPEVVILSPSNGDVFYGNNLDMNVLITDAVDKDISEYLVSLCTSYWVPLASGSEVSDIKLLMPNKDTGPAPMDVLVTAQDFSGNASSATVEVILQHDNRKK